MAKRTSIALALVACLAVSVCPAAVRNWTNADGDNAWDNANNWSGSWGTGDNLTVDLVGADRPIIWDVLAAGFEKMNRLRVGQSGGTGELEMSGGALTLGNAQQTFGWDSGSTGTLILSGGTLQTLGNLEFGDSRGDVANPATGHLIMSGGTLNVGPRLDNTTNKTLQIGAASNGSVGTAVISGGELNVSGDLSVGQGGANRTGSLTILDGVINTGDDVVIGGGENSVGTFIMSGGTLTTGVQSLRADPSGGIDADLDIGSGRSTGTMDFSGGTINIDSELRLGRTGGSFTGTVSGGTINIGLNLLIGNGNNTIDEGLPTEVITPSYGLLQMSGGLISLTAGEVRLGRNYGSGELEMSGGTIEVAAGDFLVGSSNPVLDPDTQEIIELEPGPGKLTMTGGSIFISDANSLKVGVDDSIGIVDLLGGLLWTGDLLVTPGNKINIVGGTLVVNGNQMAEVLDYIDQGLLVKYNGSPSADWLYDYNVRNPGRTTISAIPEPTTIALLGLGSVLLRRRKRS